MLTYLEQECMQKVVGEFIERGRPPPHMRKDLDFGFRISGQSVVGFEIRPRWRHRDEKLEHKVAWATLVRSRSVWRVFWQRRDLKWHVYEPVPEVDTLEEFLELVDDDANGALFG